MAPACKSQDARGIVAALQPQKNLETMLTKVTGVTQTYGMALARDGSSAEAKRAKAIDAMVEKYGAEWEQNLVSGWATLDRSDLKAACDAVSARDERKFTDIAGRAGPAIKARNEALLNKAAAEVLKAVY